MITIVSGLPRSGTSVMMQVLKAGGMHVLTDELRKADENNPRGYYEYEKVKALMKDNSWLAEAEGKTVKVIAQLIPNLPLEHQYNVIFMERSIDEILLSQNKMIDKLGGKKPLIDPAILKKTFEGQLQKVKSYLAEKDNFTTIFIDHRDLLYNTKATVENVNNTLNLNLNIENAVTAVDTTLHRNKV